MKRPVTTLFMLTSVDGKISTGYTDMRDFDKDIPMLRNVRYGIDQYHDIESKTDAWCMCTGKTKDKIGINNVNNYPKHVDANIVIIDNRHLSGMGVINLTKQYDEVVIFTTNKDHPAYNMECSNLYIHCMDEITMREVLMVMQQEYDCDRITIQTGSITNSKFLKEHLIDYVDLVIAPIIVGGDRTPSLVGGESIETLEDLNNVALLELIHCDLLKDGYLHVRYRVKNSEV